MTKKQAAEKVAKLRRLAEKAGTKQEGESAELNAKKMIDEFGLTEADLSVGAKAAAFDELIGSLDVFVKNKRDQVPGSVLSVIDQIKKHTKEDDKAAAFEKIVAAVKLGNMLFGHNKTVAAMGDMIETVITKHDVKL